MLKRNLTLVATLIFFTQNIFAQQWQKVCPDNNDIAYDIIINPGDNNHWVMRGNGTHLVTSDMGQSWLVPVYPRWVTYTYIHEETSSVYGYEASDSFSDGVNVSYNKGDWFEIMDHFHMPSDLVVNPEDTNMMFVASNAGFFKTTDYWQSLENVSEGITGGRVNKIAIDPGEVSTIFALCNVTLWKSTGYGDSWDAIDIPDFNTDDYLKFIHIPSKESDCIYITSGSQILRSDDLGENWNLYNLPSEGCTSIDFLSNDPKFIVAGFESKGIWFSTDGGETWLQSKINNQSEKIFKVRIAGIDNYVLAATENGLFKLGLEYLDVNTPNSDLDVTIYPNPAGKYINIEVQNSDASLFGKSISIYDTQGRLIMSEVITRSINPLSINIEKLEVGSYTLTISNKKGLTDKKQFVVIR